MARRDFQQPLGDQDIRDALIEFDPPVTVPFYRNSTAALSPNAPQEGEAKVYLKGALVRTVTARGTPQGTNVHVDVLGNVGSQNVTTQIVNNDGKAPYVLCVHSDSGRKGIISFPVIDVTGGGGTAK